MNFFSALLSQLIIQVKPLLKVSKSILNSTTSKNEIIIVDDKSKDKTIKKIQDIQKKINNNFVLVKNKSNLVQVILGIKV